MKYFVTIAVFLSSQAFAADRAIVANDQEVQALAQLIDEALKAKGVAVAQNAVYWLNKLQNAPVVTSQKDEPAEKPKDQGQ